MEVKQSKKKVSLAPSAAVSPGKKENAVKENSETATTPSHAGTASAGQSPAKSYPQIDLERSRIVDGVKQKKTDEPLARDVVRGGGVLVKGERVEFWFDPNQPLGKQGMEELQPSLIASFASAAGDESAAVPSAADVSSGSSTPVLEPVVPQIGKKASPKKAAPKKAAPSKAAAGAAVAARWVRGTIVSSNKGKYTMTVELDAALPVKSASSSKPVKIVVVQVKVARWKLVEYVSSTFAGLVYQPKPDLKPSQVLVDVTEEFKCELVYSDANCVRPDLAETKKEFLRQRKADPGVKRVYSFKYAVPVHEQTEMDDLKKSEREGLQGLNRELRVKTDEIEKRVAHQLAELEAQQVMEVSPLEADYEAVKRAVDIERDEKTAGLESLEGRASGSGMSLRVQKKLIDDHHKARWTKEVVPLEKRLGDMDSQFEKTRRFIDASGRDEIAELVRKKDAYVDAVKTRQQALRDKWKKLAEDDVAHMRLSLHVRIEKEFLIARRVMASTLVPSKHPEGLLKGMDTLCSQCRLGTSFQCQQNRCDTCWKFSLFEPRIEELDLKVPWAGNRPSGDLTTYHVFYHERSRSLRAERPNMEPALVSQQCKDEWKRLPEKEKLEYEPKRQALLLELLDHVEEEVDEMEMDSGGSAKRKFDEVLKSGKSEDNDEDESDEACMKCLSLKQPGLILQCDRTEGEPVDDERICGGMLHTHCCEPALAAVPAGSWFCSHLCQWVQSHKPVNALAKKNKTTGRKGKLTTLTDSLSIEDDAAEDAHSSAGKSTVVVKADVAVARTRRFEFLLSQWNVIEYFMGENAAKVKAGLEHKRAQLEAQLEGIDIESIKLRPKLEAAGLAFPVDTTPTFVKAEMREYQLEGLSWFIDQHDRGANSIMGDEMGLGKTLQTLSFMATLHHFAPFFSPFLVVCPLSVLPNWLAEAKRWTPQLHVVGLFGPLAERERIKQTLAGDAKNSVHLIVTTYEILLTEITWLRSQFYFRYFVLDEAQKIKNVDALVTQACRQIRSVYRVLLTGTPLQNNMKELWALLNFLYPEVFSLATSGMFAAAYDSTTSGDDTSGTMIKDDVLMRECHKVLEPIMLRRLKQTVLAAHLPPKTEIVLSAPMSALQQFHYRQVLKTVTGMVRNVGYKNVSSLLWQLWKCCLHPYLFDGVEEEAAGGEGHAVDAKIVYASGKMCLLDALLGKLFAQKSKALVYSQYTSMLDIIEEYCQWRGWRYLRLDGSTSLARRRFYMNLFNRPVPADVTADEFGKEHYFVFLVSTKAGGVGVNLQAANSVILYDSSWNPFVDAQAEDRAHRMGQKKEVTIYRLIASGTCEERIRYFAEQKLKMKQFVLNEDESGEKAVLDMVDEAADVSKIYSQDQLKDILEYGTLASGEAEAPAANDTSFYDACCESLDSQLSKALKKKMGGDASPKSKSAGGTQLSPVKRNICIRKFQEEDYSSTRVERTTEMDWLDVMEEEHIVQRNRKATTITVDTHERGLGKIQISRWSVEQEQREKEMMDRDRARIEAKKLGGNKRVTEHDMNCLHCHDSVLKQRVIVSTELDESGKQVKRRRVDTDNSGFQVCPICPATMHLSCLRLAVHGTDPAVRTSCPQHKCRVCRRSASNAGGLLFRCVDCPVALCYDCIEKYEMGDQFKFIEREHVAWERDLHFTAASTYEYMRCPNCIIKVESN